MDDSLVSTIQKLKIALPKKPKLASWVSIVDLGDSRLQFRGLEFQFSLEHPLFSKAFFKIQNLLDGNYSPEEIISSGGNDFRPTTLEFLLKMLCANGIVYDYDQSFFLEGADQGSLKPQINFFSHFTSTPKSTLSKLQTSQIALLGRNTETRALEPLLVEMGFRSPLRLQDPTDLENHLENDKTPIELLVAIGLGHDYQFFLEVNRICIKQGCRWMAISIGGKMSQLGPTIVPFNSACFDCYLNRYVSNLSTADGFHSWKEQSENLPSEKNLGVMESLKSIIFGQAAIEISRILSGFAPPKTIGACFELNCLSPAPKRHTVYKVPGCKSCGNPSPKTVTWAE